MAERRKCTWPEEECDGKVCVCIKDSSAPGGFEWLCLKHFNAWTPPKRDMPKVQPYERSRKRRRKAK